MKNSYSFLTSLALILALNNSARAAIEPDAGQAIQNLTTDRVEPKKSPTINFATPKTTQLKSGGVQTKIKSIVINGNNIFDDKKLLSLFPDFKNKSHDLASMQELANKITTYYHQNDYPFALALVPEQTLENGVLKIEVVEGKFGEVKIVGKNPRAKSAQKFLSALKKDEVIKGKKLERTILILDDQPGYKFVPVMSAGKEVGAGDLAVDMQNDKRAGGSIRVDNYGNRYMGAGRGTANLYANGLLMFGDQLNVTSIYTQENMWYGSAGYNLPLNHSGLRGNISYSKTQYFLGKEFSYLDSQGVVHILNSGLSYPIIRSQKSNLTIAANYQRKILTDETKSTGTINKKYSDVVPISFNFDKRDGILGGGVSYGALTLTHGVLHLGNNLKSSDDNSARTDGDFNKINLDVSRIQALFVNGATFFVRFAGQATDKNLDSSERFGLGGPNAVRAYPTGEAYGSQGYLTQAEFRYTLSSFTPYAFYDTGQIMTNHTTWSAGNNNRTLGGGGAGLRFNNKDFVFDSSIAWRTVGGNAESDSKAKAPQIWASLGYNF